MKLAAIRTTTVTGTRLLRAEVQDGKTLRIVYARITEKGFTPDGVFTLLPNAAFKEVQP